MYKNYFVIINKKTRQKLLCSWHPNEPDYFNQKVHYIGASGGLGGYNYMMENGWYDRRNFQPLEFDYYDTYSNKKRRIEFKKTLSRLSSKLDDYNSDK